MDLALTDDQIELQRAARRFATDRVGLGGRLDQDAWTDAGALGWLGIAVPETRGGSGATATDVAVIFEELGRVTATTLLFDSAVLAPAVLEAAAASWAGDVLDQILTGHSRPAVLIGTGLGLPSDRATGLRFDRATATIRGTATGVRDAEAATHFLLLAGSDDGLVCAVIGAEAAGVRHQLLAGFVPDHFRLDLDSVAVDHFSLVEFDELSTAILATIPVLCAYQVGSSQRAFELSVDYSRQRMQFGKPIGSFQRVQDHVIELINAADSCRWVTNYALWQADTSPRFADAVHVAKAVTAQAHRDACTSAHEVHAGIGADIQYGLAQHTFASRSLYSRLGDPAWHRGQLAERLRNDPSFA